MRCRHGLDEAAEKVRGNRSLERSAGAGALEPCARARGRWALGAWLLALGVALGLLALGSPARATLIGLGPIDSDHGFPSWYQDGNGLALQLCLDYQPGSIVQICGLDPVLDNFDPSLPFSVPGNFPEESFYFLADSIMPTGGGGQARLTLALEAAFSTGSVVEGQQLTFSRVRLRVDIFSFDFTLGETYTVTHPYGVETFFVGADEFGARAINFVSDFGVSGPLSGFVGALGGPIGPFLVWDPAESPPPEGYIGDPDLNHTVIGSPFGTNYFQIAGPNIGGPGIDLISTPLFSLQGKIAVTPEPTSFALLALGLAGLALWEHRYRLRQAGASAPPPCA